MQFYKHPHKEWDLLFSIEIICFLEVKINTRNKVDSIKNLNDYN